MSIKPGYLTTEFWLTTIVTSWSMFSNTVPSPWDVVIPVIAVGIYSIVRSLAKIGIVKGSVGAYLKDK